LKCGDLLLLFCDPAEAESISGPAGRQPDAAYEKAATNRRAPKGSTALGPSLPATIAYGAVGPVNAYMPEAPVAVQPVSSASPRLQAAAPARQGWWMVRA